jgi:glycine betaine/choline ABC-type transport system substrate-binding protein
MRTSLLRFISALLTVAVCLMGGCGPARRQKIVVGSKFFTEQVLLAELLAQHIEARTGIFVERKTNLGGTLLVHKAMLAGELDFYVEYTGTALTAVLNETPSGGAQGVYERVKQEYAQRFGLEVGAPLGFENTFAMVIRGEDAKALKLHKLSGIAAVAPKWRTGVGYEFLERPDGFTGLCQRYGLRFAEKPRVMDLGLIYRALVDHQVDIVAGNSTDGLIEALNLVALEDDAHYFPPYDAVPIARNAILERFPQLRAALAELAGKVTAADMRRMNYAVDGLHQEPAAVVREFRKAKGL